MEIKIGVQDIAREISLDTNDSAEQVIASYKKAIDGDGLLQLTDDRGRVIVVPTSKIAYLEIGSESARRVGFGAPAI